MTADETGAAKGGEGNGAGSPAGTPGDGDDEGEGGGEGGGGRRLLLWIGAGALLGIVVGGIAPAAGVGLEVVGEIFLNLLMMLVVPLVVLSLVAGITELAGGREVGRLGGLTLAYYGATTLLSVTVGLLLVNLFQPGTGVATGESHPDVEYRLTGEDGRTVRLVGDSLESTGYGSRFEIVLSDQEVRGTVDSVAPTLIRVEGWRRAASPEEIVRVETDDGGLRVRIEPDVLVPDRLEPDSTGRGLRVALLEVPEVAGGGDGGGALRTILVGTEDGSRQGLVPENIFQAMARGEILPLILASILAGLVLISLGEEAAPVIRLVKALNEAVLRLVRWVILLAPVGIFALLAARVGEAGGFAGFLPELVALGRYAATVAIGLAFHGVVVLPLLLLLVGRKRPWRYVTGMGSALVNAFSTASSSATLPLTIQGTTEENEVSERASGFVLPLGATINMDGTALYEAVAAVFIAQVYGVAVGFGTQIVIFLTATLAAIGAAGIPEAGLVTMVLVLQAAGLPVEGVGLILAIDWLLDRMRTAVNVWGDSVGAAVVDRLSPG